MEEVVIVAELVFTAEQGPKPVTRHRNWGCSTNWGCL